MEIALFAVGTFWFYSVLIFIGAFMFVNSFQDNMAWEIIFTILLVVLLVVSGSGAFEWIIGNLLVSLLCFLGYIVVGMLWSFFQWSEYINDSIANYEEHKRGEPIEEKNLPKVKHNLESITFWVMFWPFDVLAWGLHKPIRRLILSFSKVYGNITKNKIKKFNER